MAMQSGRPAEGRRLSAARDSEIASLLRWSMGAAAVRRNEQDTSRQSCGGAAMERARLRIYLFGASRKGEDAEPF